MKTTEKEKLKVSKKSKIIFASVFSIILIFLVLLKIFFINTKVVKFQKYNLITKNKETKETIILYFSNLFFPKNMDKERLLELQQDITIFNPDVIIFGGNLFSNEDKNKESNETVKNFLKNIDAKFGKYAIIGPNEVENEENLENYKAIMNESNFRILNNENSKININRNFFFNIIGLNKANIEFEKTISEIKNEDINIVVSHNPSLIEKLNKENVNLFISSVNTLNFNMPFFNNVLDDIDYQKLTIGKHEKNGIKYILSSGINTKKGNYRFLNNSEAIVIKIKNSN